MKKTLEQTPQTVDRTHALKALDYINTGLFCDIKVSEVWTLPYFLDYKRT